MYDFDRFYIGLIKLDNTGSESKTTLESKYLEEGGAIKISKFSNKGADNIYLGLFYKLGHDDYFNDDAYLCLNDMREYGENKFAGRSCEMLMTFDKIIPQLAFQTPFLVSIDQVKELYDSIFLSNKKFKYSNDKYDANRFYYGFLDVCDSVKKENGEYESINIPQIYLLDKNCRLSSSYYTGEKIDEFSDKTTSDRSFNSYRALFYKLDDKNYYSLSDFQIYPEKSKTYKLEKTAGYCSILVPFKEKLDDLKLIGRKDLITISQALDAEKKLIKSRKI